MSESPPRRSDKHSRKEYDGERDMDRFWQEAKPRSEPTALRWYVPTILVLIVLSIPWYLPSGQVGTVVAGFPLWIWTALGCSLGIAILTAFAILRSWKDDDPDAG